MHDVIVIGGGISGLVAAYRLKKAGRDVLLLEGSDRPGGVIRTDVVDGFVLERGPNSVRLTDELEGLVEELDLNDELVTGDPRAPRYVFVGGSLVRAPMGPASLLTTPLISKRAKMRLLREPFIGRPKTKEEQSIESFVVRRLGREIHDTLVSAFISGIYAGDTSKLSAEAVFPKLVEMERDHGGLARAALAMVRDRKKSDGAKNVAAAPAATGESAKPRRKGMTIMSFRSGLARLPERIGELLGESMALRASVISLTATTSGFAVETESGDRLECRSVVVATPAGAAGRLLAGIAPAAQRRLDEIEYPPLASVSLAYDAREVTHSCEGFGFLAPRSSGLRTLGAIFTSSLFPDRAPDGWQSFTCFIGGATDPSAVELVDEALTGAVASDLRKAVGAYGEPKVLGITRWARAIPQYTIGHLARVAEIEEAASSAGIRLLGNHLHGISVGECVASANRLARALSERAE